MASQVYQMRRDAAIRGIPDCRIPPLAHALRRAYSRVRSEIVTWHRQRLSPLNTTLLEDKEIDMKRITLAMLVILALCAAQNGSVSVNASAYTPGPELGVAAMGMSEVARAEAPPSHVLVVPDEYPTIQAAVDAAYPGDKIMVGPGDYAGALITQPVELIGSGLQTRITSSAPAFVGAGFYVHLDQGGPQDPGVSISHFTFECSGYPSMTGMFAGVVVRAVDYTKGHKSYNVDISHNTFHEGYYGVYIINADQCAVSHNDVVNAETPIMLWAYLADSSNNLIAYNSIQSDVEGSNTGQWRNVGIWLNAYGGGIVTNNQVIHNKIVRTGGSLTYPAYAVFLRAVTGGDITNNYIGFNDFRGSENEIGASPPDLLNRNEISHNHGL
jgi:hypothetical protein